MTKENDRQIARHINHVLNAGVITAVMLLSTTVTANEKTEINYLTAPYQHVRILDWGNRPNWSPDGSRIAFTKDDLVDSPAYEIDLDTNEVRCLTCHFDKTQFVTRIFYLPDESFLIEAAPGMVGGSGGGADAGRTELFWMSKSFEQPVSLGTLAMGDIAIARKANADGSVDIAWARPKDKGLHLVMATLENDGHSARLVNIQELYNYQPGQSSVPSIPEAYEFIDDNQAVMFWTIELATMDSEMYQVNIETGEVSKVYATPAHNETHLFPDERYGLEEANFLSDPNGPYRGISALGKEGVELFLQMQREPRAAELAQVHSSKGFDIYVITMDGKSRRALTNISASGAQAHQSVVSPDGRKIAFAIKDGSSSKPSGHAVGLYVGTFGN